MITDETLYDTEGQLVAKDITVRTYFPLENDEIIIDLDNYYEGLCCFEVVAVESRQSDQTEGIFISYDKRRIRYEVNKDDQLWTEEGAYDVVRYVIRDLNEDKTATGEIRFERIEKGGFEAKDIHVALSIDKLNSFDWLTVEPFIVDAALVNKFDNVRVIEFGDYNERIFKSVGINVDKQSELVFEFERECVNIVPCRKSEVEYAVEAEVAGKKTVSKAKVFFHFQCRGFYAEYIEIEVPEPVPASTFIDIRAYNQNFASISLTDVDDNTPSERGSILVDEPSNSVTYHFNQDSGFWDEDGVEEAIQYEITNHVTGQEALAYIVIRKEGEPSGSGTGSGAGGTVASILNSGDTTSSVDLNNILEISESPDIWEADLDTITDIELSGIPGTNTVTGGKVQISILGSDGINDIGVITKLSDDATKQMELNGLAKVSDLTAYFLVPESDSPIESWNVTLVDKNPLGDGASTITFS